jgi:hypothetical protein
MALAQGGTPVYEFKNGNWYNGSGFAEATWYSVGGKLTKKKPAKVDEVIDLAGRWAVPPLGDAFCASVADNPSAKNQLKSYADEGVFYLQILGNTQEGRKAVEPLANKPESPDALFANGAFTCTLGYPFLQYEGPAQGVRNPKLMADQYGKIKEGRKMEGDGYWFVDSKAALDKIWDKVKAQKPGVISIYLLDADKSGGKETKGLTPDVAKAVVKKAHKSGLRVFAHVETAADVTLGIKLGVDGFANLPGHNWDGTGDGKKYELNDQDLKKLAKKKTPVIPLFSHLQTQNPRPGAQEYQIKVMKQLLDNGVNVVIGSDDTQRTIRGELNYWYQAGNLDYARTLQILCVNTPQAIFPKRKIGRIEEGYEASFIVLSDNPLNNILKLRAIAFKVKNGTLLK